MTSHTVLQDFHDPAEGQRMKLFRFPIRTRVLLTQPFEIWEEEIVAIHLRLDLSHRGMALVFDVVGWKLERPSPISRGLPGLRRRSIQSRSSPRSRLGRNGCWSKDLLGVWNWNFGFDIFRMQKIEWGGVNSKIVGNRRSQAESEV